MNTIIIADKFQKRMKSKGCVGLIKDKKNKTFVEKQYAILNDAFHIKQIAYIYGFDGKRFESFFLKNEDSLSGLYPIYNPNYEKYNTGFSLSFVAKFLEDECMILFGDTNITKQTFKNFDNQQSQLFLCSSSNSGLGCVIQDDYVRHISYQLDNTLSEIYYLNKEAAFGLSRIVATNKFNQYFLFELINKLIDNKHIMHYHVHK